jgi:hypothetical protein
MIRTLLITWFFGGILGAIFWKGISNISKEDDELLKKYEDENAN